mmetsp:Transcript_10688/g.15937  ORF Transcript_10688/g.15937 Transcript_10688/m.15937 type:complete len:81 (-) Transcript_10688:298-540(-)
MESEMDLLEQFSQSPPLYKRPRGAPPKGKTWNYRTGEWVDDGCDQSSTIDDADYEAAKKLMQLEEKKSQESASDDAASQL